MCILHAERARDIAFANSSMLSSNNDQSKGLSNYGDESNPKPRKPYTITKQREKWTDEEHEKFLEALKLYGRGWRNIEEHVGTKTAIQIRSHAQKFFSKVVRESASNGKESPIEIPPPRPKRRPSHPYPRKLTIVPTKSILSVQKGDRHSSVMSSSLDQEKESPTSVLSLAASEIMSSRTYDATKQCISSDSSNSVPRASPGCEISCKSAHSQAEEANQGSSSGAQTSCNNQDVVVSKNGNSLKSFQLFGTLVVVEDRKSQPSPKDKSSIPASSRNPEDSLALGKTDRQVSAPKRAMKSIAAGSSTVPAGANSHCSCGLLPFFYPMPSQHGGATKQETAAPLTWLPLYSNPAFPPDQSFFGISLQDPDSETSGDKKEDASATGAKPEDCGSASSSHAEEAAGKKTPTQSPKARGFLPYKRRQAERDAKTTGPKWSSGDQKGFIPYKQCLMEREAMQQQSEDGGECREHQRVKLC